MKNMSNVKNLQEEKQMKFKERFEAQPCQPFKIVFTEDATFMTYYKSISVQCLSFCCLICSNNVLIKFSQEEFFFPFIQLNVRELTYPVDLITLYVMLKQQL